MRRLDPFTDEGDLGTKNYIKKEVLLETPYREINPSLSCTYAVHSLAESVWASAMVPVEKLEMRRIHKASAGSVHVPCGEF